MTAASSAAGLTIGSLFSGIGGLELGLERAGLGPLLWQVERDPFCRRVLAKHWPDVTRHDDVTTARALPHVDVVCGGFPCQDVSIAGRGAGLAGERSGLWREMLRVVLECRPRFVVVENVPGLMRRGLDDVIAGLSDAGYAMEGTRIRAEDVGAPHRRERLFVIAYAERDALRVRPERVPARREARELQAAREGVAVHDGEPRGLARCGARAWSVEPSVGRMAHGIPHRVDRLRALGNAVVPQVAEVVGRRVMQLATEAAA